MCEWLILLLFLCRCNHGGNVCCDNWQNNKDCSCYRRSDNDYKQSRRNNGDCGRNRSCDDDCDCDCCDDEVYEIECPACNDVIYLDDEMIDEGGIKCPNCGEELEFDFSCDECCGCDGKDE